MLCVILRLLGLMGPPFRGASIPSLTVALLAFCAGLILSPLIVPQVTTQSFETRLPSRASASIAEVPQPPTIVCIGLRDKRRCWPKPAIPYRLLFHANQLSERGTEVALYDYAHFFETLGFGVSYIASNRGSTTVGQSKFEARFPGRVFLLDNVPGPSRDNPNPDVTFASLAADLQLDAIYTIQAGTEFDFRMPESLTAVMRFMVHGVFGSSAKSSYHAVAAISPIVADVGVPVVGHMVYANEPATSIVSLRKDLEIHDTTKVFCRHGGGGTFSIGFAREAVCKHARTFPHDLFLLLGTDAVACDVNVPNIRHLPTNTGLLYKQRFLKSCNACLHGREDGETFGLAIAECSIAGLPVITYGQPPQRANAHLVMQKDLAIKYNSADDLEKILSSFNVSAHQELSSQYQAIYSAYSPDAVMSDFLEKFEILRDVQRGGRAEIPVIKR